MNLPVVVIVGRPNVGKSALFNRIVGRRVAIVHEQAGVTRDRVASVADYDGRRFLLVDTGGLGVFLDTQKGVEKFDSLIREQVELVLKDAACVIFTVDAMAGMNPLDSEIAQFLRRQGRPVILAANKTDDPQKVPAARDAFLSLKFHIEPVSSLQGLGIGDLLASVVDQLPEPAAGESGDAAGAAAGTAPVRLAVIGRPNVGKSSLVNQLIGQNRMIVSDIPGTTRDAVDVPIVLPGPGGQPQPAVIIDTAGLRPKHKVDNVVEIFSVMRSQNAIKRADIVLFLLDAGAPPTAQDRRIASLIGEAHKPCILVANKIDLLPPKTRPDALEAAIRREMPFMRYAPIVSISAMHGRNLTDLKARVARLHEKLQTPIPTSILNQFLNDLVARTPPPAIKGKHLKVFYTTMIHTPPPHLVMFVNHRELGTSAYIQFLESRTCDAFFPEGGMPVTIELRNRPQKEPEERRAARRDAAASTASGPNDGDLSPSERRRKMTARHARPGRPSHPARTGHDRAAPQADREARPGRPDRHARDTRPARPARPGHGRHGGGPRRPGRNSGR